jgi:Rad3-related DNA helicase
VSDANGKRKYTAPEPAPSIFKKKTTESSKPKVDEKSTTKQSSAEEKQKDEKKEDETKTEEKSEKVLFLVNDSYSSLLIVKKHTCHQADKQFKQQKYQEQGRHC